MNLFAGEILVHPKSAPSGIGIGMLMRGEKPMLWAVTRCCMNTLQRSGDGDGNWDLEWFCHGCTRVVRSGGVALPVGQPINIGDGKNSYMNARIWVGDWCGLSRYAVKIRVVW